MALYALGDLHLAFGADKPMDVFGGRWQGYADKLREGLSVLQPEDTLYVLGDVIDRYPQGVRILRQIMAMENVKMLLGNHEYMMLRALGRPCDDNVDDGRAVAHWYRNGGGVTHRH